jgi:hypothetical protein
LRFVGTTLILVKRRQSPNYRLVLGKLMQTALRYVHTRCIDGYRLLPAEKPKRANASAILIAKEERFEPMSARLDPYEPLRIERLFTRFAEVKDGASALRFLGAFGYPLSDDGWTLAPMLRAAAAMREAIAALKADDRKMLLHLFAEAGIGRLTTELRLIDGAFAIVLVPTSLLQAMWIQFAQVVVSGAAIASCEQCGAIFPTGTGTGRRNTARFCSDSCRKAHLYQRRVAR